MSTGTVNQESTVASEVSAWGVGAGILTTVLFPFSIPLVALTAVAALPLVPVALGVALVALPLLAVRGLVRRVSAAVRV